MCLVFFVSCNEELILQERENVSTKSTSMVSQDSVQMKKDFILKKDFAKALAKIFQTSRQARQLVKNEALKMIDYDYDVLYQLIKDEKLEDGLTLESALQDYLGIDKINLINSKFPTLTLFVPVLPENSFSAEAWDIDNEVPQVAIRCNYSSDVSMYNAREEENILTPDFIPGYPVVVVKDNERIEVNNYNKFSNSTFDGVANSIYTPSGLSYTFIDPIFNNVNKVQLRDRWLNPEIKDEIQKSFDAYNVYKTADGWQRDYIYYNITPTNSKGQFNLNYKECLCSFQMQGDPNTAYQKLSDQTGDPTLDYNYTWSPRGSYLHNPWTDGEFEFKVKVYVGSKQPTGSEHIFAFRAKADDLFNVTYKKIEGGAYKVNGISENRKFSLKLPLFEWDLENYSPIISIIIEEVDASETVRSTSQTTTEFAGNFEFNAKLGVSEKVGLKFGGSAKQSFVTTYEKTTTFGNDELNEVIVNFGDPIVLQGDWVKTPAGREGSFLYSIPFNDKYYNGWYKIEIAPLKMY